LQESPYWWIDHVSTVASVPLALIGFGITFWQLARTRKAANAALAAAENTQRQIRKLSIVALLPQLHRIDEELHRAVEQGSVELVRFWISNWQWQAGETRGYLLDASPEEETIMRALQSSIVAAASVRNDLIGIAPHDLKRTTVTVRKRIGAVTSQLGELAARRSTDGGPA
jgi:hypothetical protein